ncbi:MAG: hypothetical protein IJH38_00720, partial [Clostridia bacterium]|nr:hypothetical protein [Clostridia bacterium]
MTKARVQDVTKELSASTGKMLEDVSRMRRQSQDLLGALRRISDGFIREERERQEREAREELLKQYQASAQFMTAYSSEQVPEIPDAPAPVEQPVPEKAPEKAPETAVEEAVKAPEQPAVRPSPAAPAPQSPLQRPAYQARPQQGAA